MRNTSTKRPDANSDTPDDGAAWYKSDDAALQDWLEHAEDGKHWQAELGRIARHSSHLQRLLEKYPDTTLAICREGPQAAFADALGQLERIDITQTPQPDIMQQLRQTKARASLAIALADCTGDWDARTVTRHLSDLADGCISLSVDYVLHELHKAGVITLADPSQPSEHSGLFILAMGKLGAHELNYSSDIDLMLLFDPETLPYAGDYVPQQKLIQLGNQLIDLMQTRTEDGYVFRVDVRLRPDPGSTPMVMSSAAAMHYYETVGQNWERAAMIKARPVGGDKAAAKHFLEQLSPFIWRKYLDFAAIEDIQSIRRQIDHKIGSSEDDEQDVLSGYHVKLGAGGIRDIEFYTQTHQLTWGGKHPTLRLRRTEDALTQLATQQIITQENAVTLTESYWLLRRVEHGLQMLQDEQTHTLPEQPQQWQSLAALLGYESVDNLQLTIEKTRHKVIAICRPANTEDSQLTSGQRNLVFTGVEDDPDTLENLKDMGFSKPEMVTDTIRGWHHGRIKATRTERARQLLTELAPNILQAFADTGVADAAFKQFNGFFSELPEGVQLLSLFSAQPALLQLVADIMGSAPHLAEMLSLNPRLLDRLLDSAEETRAPSFRRVLSQDMDEQLATARDLEDSLHLLRQLKQEYSFLIAVRLLIGDMHFDTATRCFTLLAETMLARLVSLTQEAYAEEQGDMDGGSLCVLAMGKLGARHLSFDSDLDLVFLYDMEGKPGSENRLSPDSYYNRLVQRVVTGSTALMKYGRLYPIDLRLRPHGDDGASASKLATFTRYYTEDAWSYEWFALTRARVICGDAALCEKVGAIIARLLTRKQDAQQLKADLLDLRVKIRANLPPKNIWDVKYQEGGLLDLEFLIQYMQLLYGHEEPSLLQAGPMDTIQMLTFHDKLDKHDAVALSRCMERLMQVQQVLRICSPEISDSGNIAHHFRRLLAQILGSEATADMQLTLEKTYAEGYRLFRKILSY